MLRHLMQLSGQVAADYKKRSTKHPELYQDEKNWRNGVTAASALVRLAVSFVGV